MSKDIINNRTVAGTVLFKYSFQEEKSVEPGYDYRKQRYNQYI